MTSQKQKSGDNSVNLQAGSVVFNGLSYSEVKEIALDIFNQNFLKLSEEALKIAKTRAEEITNSFIERLKAEKPSAIDSVKDPSFQHSLFEAQKCYAKTGDKDMADVLVDVLVDRADNDKRDLKQIVLDESITVISKLTPSQLDTLTIIFLIRYTKNYGIKDLKTFQNYLKNEIAPFTKNLSKDLSQYQHLEFAGCGSIGIGVPKIESIHATRYRGLFFKGFDGTESEIERDIWEIVHKNELIMKCLNDEKKYQINTMDIEVLENFMEEKKLNEETKAKLKKLYKEFVWTDEEVKKKMLELGETDFNNLLDVWDNSELRRMTLTSVGIAIAQANYRRKTGKSLDLSIWIK